MPNISFRDLELFVTTWVAADLPNKPIAPLFRITMRKEELGAEFTPIRESGHDRTKEIAQELAAGTMTAIDAVTAHLAGSAGREPGGAGTSWPRWRTLYDGAIAALIREAEEILRTTDYSEIIHNENRKIPSEPALEGINTAEQAIAAGKKAVEAWAGKEARDRKGALNSEAWRALQPLMLVLKPSFPNKSDGPDPAERFVQRIGA